MAAREGIIVSYSIKILLEKLASTVLLDFGSNWKVEKELEELSDTLESIQAMLGCLELMQTRNSLVKLHLKKLKAVASNVDVVLQDFINEVHRRERDRNRGRRQAHTYISFSLNVNQMLSQSEIGPYIIDLKEKLVQIEKNLQPYYTNGISLHMKGQLKSYTVEEEEEEEEDARKKNSTSLIDESRVVGREDDIGVIRSKLLDQINSQKEVPVIAIVGDEDCGKTTLAQLVYNDSKVETHFDSRAWVCVSEDFNVERISRSILESATREPCKLKNMEALQRKLQEHVKGKKFLLVLDDVGKVKETSWNVLKAPFRSAHEKSRIIITSRVTTLPSFINIIHCHNLQSLSI